MIFHTWCQNYSFGMICEKTDAISEKKIDMKSCHANSDFVLQEDISAIFSKADKNKTGKLNVEDFSGVINDIIERYPQVELHLKSEKLKSFVQLLQSNQDPAAKKRATMDIEKFKSALSEVDTKMKNLPPTAQVNLNNVVTICCSNLLSEFLVFYFLFIFKLVL